MKIYRFKVYYDPMALPSAQQKGERIVAGKYIHHFVKRPVSKKLEALAAAIGLVLSDEVLSRAPTAGPWRVSAVMWYRPKTLLKRDLGAYKVTRPDSDNLFKGLLDTLSKFQCFWKDDSQVQIGRVERRFVASKVFRPCIDLELEEMDDGRGGI